MDELRISVTDKNGLEYGRLNKSIERKAGDAGFIEFVFTSKTDIEDESHILIEAFWILTANCEAFFIYWEHYSTYLALNARIIYKR